jgi:hypothetical protein
MTAILKLPATITIFRHLSKMDFHRHFNRLIFLPTKKSLKPLHKYELMMSKIFYIEVSPSKSKILILFFLESALLAQKQEKYFDEIFLDWHFLHIARLKKIFGKNFV